MNTDSELDINMQKLLIVESPTKAKTIGRMLDDSYQILASMGHIRDLPDRSLGIDIEKDFTPLYVDSDRSRKVIAELRAAAKKADEIYLAPDPDREGEAIAWHLYEVLKGRSKTPFHRVSFHEITRSAIAHALAEKTEINMNLVDAQQARRVLDRLVGYKVSPLLWSRVEKGISAGRVQSVALRLIVEREREITGFKPEEYWVFSLICQTADGREFKCRLFKINGKDFKIGDGEAAGALLAALVGGSAPEVTAVTSADRKRNAPPPFTTSTLQQAASNAYHYSATNTMRYAQQLYEGVEIGSSGSVGLITYMRTDSVTIAKEAQSAALDFIKANYGASYVPARPNFFKNKAAAQEAHEAIRPTDVTRTPESMEPYLDASQLKVYTMIYRRFLASQMSPCIQKLTTVDVGIAGGDRNAYTFRATATVPVFDGFTRLYNDDAKPKRDEAETASVLGSLREKERLTAKEFEKEQKFTEPPPRYTEATLIKELEENGIGRPSTYATILRTIQQREYVSRDQGRLVPTELGNKTCDFLVENLSELFNVNFTAEMERELDEIENGTIKWTGMLADFYKKFEGWLDHARHNDAPPEESAAHLIAQLEHAEFAPPRKVERRTYDDRKLYNSLREQFEKTGKITARQYQTLLNMVHQYNPRAAAADDLSAELKKDLATAAKAHEERSEKQAANQVSPEEQATYERMFGAFDAVKWEAAAPARGKGRAFSEEKFFTSLKQQALSGRRLSEKQLAVLARMAVKYSEQLANAEFVLATLNAEVPSAPQSAEAAADILELLEKLEKVQNWAPPSKKGRFSFDDKVFYQSLARQFREKKQLSDKQRAALAKMAAKYKAEIEPGV
jgi:DNA topoisomerase-1